MILKIKDKDLYVVSLKKFFNITSTKKYKSKIDYQKDYYNDYFFRFFIKKYKENENFEELNKELTLEEYLILDERNFLCNFAIRLDIEKLVKTYIITNEKGELLGYFSTKESQIILEEDNLNVVVLGEFSKNEDDVLIEENPLTREDCLEIALSTIKMLNKKQKEIIVLVDCLELDIPFYKDNGFEEIEVEKVWQENEYLTTKPQIELKTLIVKI